MVSLSLSIVASRFFSFFFSIRMQLLYYSAVYSKAYPPWKAEQTALTNVVIWCIQRPVICWRPITFLGKFSIQGEEWKIVSLISLFIRVEINSVWIFQLNKNSNGDDSTLSSEKKQIKTKTFKNLRKTRNTGLRKETLLTGRTVYYSLLFLCPEKMAGWRVVTFFFFKKRKTERNKKKERNRLALPYLHGWWPS